MWQSVHSSGPPAVRTALPSSANPADDAGSSSVQLRPGNPSTQGPAYPAPTGDRTGRVSTYDSHDLIKSSSMRPTTVWPPPSAAAIDRARASKRPRSDDKHASSLTAASGDSLTRRSDAVAARSRGIASGSTRQEIEQPVESTGLLDDLSLSPQATALDPHSAPQASTTKSRKSVTPRRAVAATVDAAPKTSTQTKKAPTSADTSESSRQPAGRAASRSSTPTRSGKNDDQRARDDEFVVMEQRRRELIQAWESERGEVPAPLGISRSAPRKWTAAEDALLEAAVTRCGASNWRDIAKEVAGRTHVQCLQRWKKVLQPGLVKVRDVSRRETASSSLIHESGRVTGLPKRTLPCEIQSKPIQAATGVRSHGKSRVARPSNAASDGSTTWLPPSTMRACQPPCCIITSDHTDGLCMLQEMDDGRRSGTTRCM